METLWNHIAQVRWCLLGGCPHTIGVPIGVPINCPFASLLETPPRAVTAVTAVTAVAAVTAPRGVAIG